MDAAAISGILGSEVARRAAGLAFAQRTLGGPPEKVRPLSYAGAGKNSNL